MISFFLYEFSWSDNASAGSAFFVAGFEEKELARTLIAVELQKSPEELKFEDRHPISKVVCVTTEQNAG